MLNKEKTITVSLDEYNRLLESQKQVDELKKRLHWIWAIGVDYDGCNGVESLKELIDELVELTQIESKDLDEYFTYNTTQGGKMNILDIVRKIERKDTANKIFRQVLSLYQGLSKVEKETMTFEWKLLDLAVEYGVEVE